MDTTYTDKPERVMTIGKFYCYDPKRDEFNVREFWLGVAREATRRMMLREMQARALARRLRLVRLTAAERDAAYRAQIESLKREIENRDYVAEIYQEQIEALKMSEQHWHANAVQMMDERDLWKAKARNE